MRFFLQKYLYVLLTVACATYTQVMLKWQMPKVGDLPPSLIPKLYALIRVVLTNGYIFSAYAVALVSSLFWLLALRTLPLNVAYPMLSLSFVTVILSSLVIFKESLQGTQILGIVFIFIGGYLINIGQSHASSTI